MRRKKSLVSNFISYVLIIMLLIIIAGFFTVFLSDDTSTSNIISGKAVVQYNNRNLSKNDSSLSLPFNENLEFKINFFSKNKGYNVKIVPCGYFSYTANGAILSSEKIITAEKLRDYYSVEKNDNSFTLRLKEFNALTLVKSSYDSSVEIVFPEGVKVFGSYYALVISFDGEAEDYKMPFTLVSPVEIVELEGSIVL